MNRHPLYGLVVPEKNWVPAPRFLLRRERILKMLRKMPKGRVLEIGCGAGTLLGDLSELGFQCDALETSPQALELAKYVHKDNPAVCIHDKAQADWSAAFDYVLAFEVLEHVEEDVAALSEWRNWVKPGGTVLLSVPAHQRRFNAVDVWAGHFRRYDKRDLLRLVEEAGFENPNLECYGFPLADIIERTKAVAYRKKSSQNPDGAELAQNTSRSGTERNVEMQLFGFQESFLGVCCMRLSFLLQRLFLKTSLGGCFLIQARCPYDEHQQQPIRTRSAA